MTAITKYLNEKITPYSYYITILGLFVIFISAILIFYFFYFKNSPYNLANNPFGDVSNESRNLTMYYCYVDWCIYCQKATPLVDSFIDKYDNTVIKGNVLKIIKKNLTNDTDKSVIDFINKYNIESFPTVFIIDENEKRYDFKGRVTIENLTRYINSY
jgi:thiol-disulfide isomerase/thioredoxin